MAKALRLFDTRQKTRALFILVLTILNSFAEVLGLALIIPVIYLINDSRPIYNNKSLNHIYELTGFNKESHFIFCLIAIMLVLFALKNIFSIFVYYRQNKFSFDVSLKLVQRQAAVLFSSPYLRVLDRNSNYLVREVANIPSEFGKNMLIPLLKITNEWIVLTTIVVGLILFNVKIFLLLALTLGPMMAAILMGTRRKAKEVGALRNEFEPLSYKIAYESVFSLSDIRLFNKESYFIEKIHSRFKKLFYTFLWIYTLQRIPNRIMETFIILAILLLYGFVVLLMNEPTEFIFTILLLFATAAYRVMPSMNEILGSMILMRSTSYVFDILDNDDVSFPEIHADEKIAFSDHLELKDITYKYPKGKLPVLHNLDLNIRKGEFISISGESGAGKSTLAKILVQLIRQDSGSFLVDGAPLENERAWHDNVVLVQQHFYLLDGTIAENIAFGLDAGQWDQEELQKAIKAAGLESFVQLQDAGVSTRIGEFGTRLSGGQQQRIAIARALYKKADILVFDESTSALDKVTEQALLATLKELNALGITIILISHRESVLSSTHRHYRMEAGKLMNV
ncbi:MAG: ABC transporter ATP-binding protein [Bacteroidetes bacterium]|nr:ABC transporter ATP-binding protein [Bacteroidota bacterium]